MSQNKSRIEQIVNKSLGSLSQSNKDNLVNDIKQYANDYAKKALSLAYLNSEIICTKKGCKSCYGGGCENPSIDRKSIINIELPEHD